MYALHNPNPNKNILVKTRRGISKNFESTIDAAATKELKSKKIFSSTVALLAGTGGPGVVKPSAATIAESTTSSAPSSAPSTASSTITSPSSPNIAPTDHPLSDTKMSAPAAKFVYPHHHHKPSRNPRDNKSPSQEPIAPQHLEMIRYVHDSWKRVEREYQMSSSIYNGGSDQGSLVNNTNGGTSSLNKVPKVCYYQDKSVSARLKNFEPFDLEVFWGQQLLHNITSST